MILNRNLPFSSKAKRKRVTRTFAICPRCTRTLTLNKVPGYTYSCEWCYEDFYRFEVLKAHY